MSYEDYKSRVIAAQEQWNRDREAVYQFIAGTASGFTGGFENLAIPGPDNYDIDLLELIKKVDAMRPGVALKAGEVWRQIKDDFHAATGIFNAEFSRTVNGLTIGNEKVAGWSGKSGPAAASAVTAYSTDSESLSTAASLVSLKMFELNTGLNQTQALMPYVPNRPDLAGKTLPENGLMKEGDYSLEEVEDEARRILRTVYAPVANQTDHGVPILPNPKQIVDNPVVPPPVAPPPVVPPGGGQPEPGTPGPNGNQGENPEGTPEDNPQQSEDPGQTTQPAATTPQSVESTNGNTQPAGTTPTTPSTTTAGTPTTTTTPGTPSNLGTPSTTGIPSTTGSPGTPNAPGTTPSPGRSVTSVPQQAGTPLAANAAASTATGRAGAPGMGGMPPGAAGRGKGEGEETSSTKDYLINQQNGEEVTGLDSLDRTVPPVIGAD